jgi:hypothetical protein
MMAVSIFSGLVVSQSKEVVPEILRHVSTFMNFFASRTSYITSTSFQSTEVTITIKKIFFENFPRKIFPRILRMNFLH